MRDRCRISKIEDYFVLIAGSKLPISTEAIEKIINTNTVPYEYDVNSTYLQKNAKTFGQYSDLLRDD